MNSEESLQAVVVVAHPDDETIWAGGTILMHPTWSWRVVTLCRASDPDRAPRFREALSWLGADGAMGDLDDGPDQRRLGRGTVEAAVRELCGEGRFDLVVTHSLSGEYTRHRRHEEVGEAVVSLWETDSLKAEALWMFAYDDDQGRGAPRPLREAHRTTALPRDVVQTKRRIVQQVYGLQPGSFEYEAANCREAFWTFQSPDEVRDWQCDKEKRL